ncbi:MAG: fatty acid desaturase [Alphaproteobacteria bacterium]
MPAPPDDRIPVDRAWIGAPAGTLANPTVGVLVLSLAMFSVGTLAWSRGAWPAWAVVANGAVALYLVFTPLHESMHGVAHRDRVANEAIGRIAGLLLIVSLPLFRAVHQEHHSHTNDPERDPDFVVSRRPRWLLPLWCLAILPSYEWHFWRRRTWRSEADRREALWVEIGTLAFLASAAAAGFGRDVLVTWVGPALLAQQALAFWFDFVPHWPYDSRARYRDTRIWGGPIANALLLGQNQHLVHHLWPTIPWFRYRHVTATVRDELVSRGSRVEGEHGAVANAA